ncbi:hypothetical protein GALL_00900 [mine drainage metagenome]|uniref:Secreted protein n=2 Tax=root TaxID=1 RepID=A0AAN1XCW7_9PROT|nr:hypothetical protein [Sideroxyarcus emersonii]BCK88757.1 hypothetical protein MIZ01_2563 [Sideroxyarcus emersonii]
MKKKIALIVVLGMAAVSAFAGGAPWYKWINRYDRTIICAQISPGEAWIQYQGPFMEARCSKPGVPQ